MITGGAGNGYHRGIETNAEVMATAAIAHATTARGGVFVCVVHFTYFDYLLYFTQSMQTNELKLPSSRTAEEARAALRVLTGLSRTNARSIQLRPEDEARDISVTIPRDAFELFLEVLGQMANGNAVTIVPVHAELTTQEAAELLNVSRPFLVKLLEEDKIPSRKVGAHRRIRAEDLLAYKEQEEAHRKKILDELTAEAEKHGLGY